MRKAVRLKERIATLNDEMRRVEGLKQQMKASADGQVSLTDPGARSMASRGKGTGIVGDKVQTTVDAQHHLIVAEKAREAMGTEELTAVADLRYFKRDTCFTFT